MIIKKSLKYINVLMLFIIVVSCVSFKFNAYTETGHEDFQKIKVKGVVKLLNEYSNSEIDDEIKKLSFKLSKLKKEFELEKSFLEIICQFPLNPFGPCFKELFIITFLKLTVMNPLS